MFHRLGLVNEILTILVVIVAEAITCIIGLVLGQIRTLQRLGFLANAAVWLNVFVIIMTMIVVHKYPPNFAAAEVANHVTEGPIIASANWPEGLGLSDYMAGVMNCVFAYGGAMLFTELMAEMKRPMDFWKSLVCAELFIYAVYITMGMVVYSAQGQFTYPLAYQGIPASAYVWQTLGNAVAYTSGLIAMALYGNIGIKIIYASVLQDVFKFPALDKKMGKIIWALIVPVYWGLAFVVAAAVPQIANLFTLVGALCILQFQYVSSSVVFFRFVESLADEYSRFRRCSRLGITCRKTPCCRMRASTQLLEKSNASITV